MRGILTKSEEAILKETPILSKNQHTYVEWEEKMDTLFFSHS